MPIRPTPPAVAAHPLAFAVAAQSARPRPAGRAEPQAAVADVTDTVALTPPAGPTVLEARVFSGYDPCKTLAAEFLRVHRRVLGRR